MARIVVGYDGSPPARRALDHAVARRLEGDELHLVSALPPSVRNTSLASMMPAGIELPPQLGATFLERAKARMDEVVAELSKRGVKATGHVRLGEPAEALLALAVEVQADLVVIGHKSYQGGAALGPNASAIVRQARVPVTVVP